MANTAQTGPREPVQIAVLVLSAACSLLLFVWMFRYAAYGLDLSDEGFYLNSIARPSAYPVNIPPSVFGFAWNLPYGWLDGDIVALRRINLSLTFVLSLTLSWCCVQRFWPSWQGLAAATGFAALGLVSYRWWLLTPSYNSLNFQAVMIVTIGLLLTEIGRRPSTRFAGWLSIAMGGWLGVLAKPTTALAMGIIVLLYVAIMHRERLRTLLLAALFSAVLVVISAYGIDGSLQAFAERFLHGAAAVSLLGSGHELVQLIRIDRPDIGPRGILAAVGIALLAFAGQKWTNLGRLALPVIFGMLLVIAAIIILTGLDPIGFKPNDVFLLSMTAAIALLIATARQQPGVQTRSNLALALILLVVPHTLALGTNNNYWVVASFAGLMWLLAAATLFAPLAGRGFSTSAMLLLAAASSLIAASIVNAGIAAPYRQVFDLRSYDARIDLPGIGYAVVADSFYAYLTDAGARAASAGLEPNTPAVDLSGRSPTLLYALDTRPLGQAWMVGAYPGSNAVAVATLGLETCSDLAGAWILIEPGGPRHLDAPQVLASFGATEDDYQAVATFTTPRNDGDYPDAVEQVFLKPVRSKDEALVACEAARTAIPGTQIWSD